MTIEAELAGKVPALDAVAVPALSIVVPTFNEVANVPLLVDKIRAVFPDQNWEIVFVDDDSTDGTEQVLHGLCRKYPFIRSLRRIGRRGLSSAVVEGILSTSAPFVAVMDGDLQHDERLLPAMLAELQSDKADLVVGSRYLQGGSTGEWDASRVRMSRIATYLSGLITDAQCTDPMSGFFMIRRTTFDGAVRQLSGQGFKILLDIMASSPTPPRLKELPYTFGIREHGESKLNSVIALEYINLILDKLVGRWIPVRFIMFSLVGGLGVFVHMSVLTVLHFLGEPFVYSQSLATVAAMTFNFFLNNILTYRDKRLKGTWPILKGLLSFFAVCSFGAIANVGIANVLFQRSFTWWLSAIAGIFVGVVWNFAATSIFIWKRR
ncbi:MAG: glycosyltransferase family 2 protein [Hyphomicrobium sp.]|uniref:glycosyltransferase n=1 Tax=Hyphomicrobium sp. TaxID=82 RepID=UPI0039E5973F